VRAHGLQRAIGHPDSVERAHRSAASRPAGLKRLCCVYGSFWELRLASGVEGCMMYHICVEPVMERSRSCRRRRVVSRTNPIDERRFGLEGGLEGALNFCQGCGSIVVAIEF
jgi:hypothetical protein